MTGKGVRAVLAVLLGAAALLGLVAVAGVAVTAWYYHRTASPILELVEESGLYDADGDGRTTAGEFLDATDGDGVSDVDEVHAGTDPFTPN